MKKISFFLFITTLIFAPLAFGTSEQWSLFIVEVLIALAFLTFFLQTDGPSNGLVFVPGMVPLLLLASWMIIQVLPLPPFLVKLFSPETYQVYKPVYAMLEGDRWLPLTVYRKATLLEFARILSYFFCYFLTVQLLCTGKRLKRTVEICAYLAIFIALIAILQKFSSPDKIYWFRTISSGVKPTGPWVYRSQYCGYMEMVVPLVLALFLYYQPTINKEETFRARIVSFFSMRNLNISILTGFGLLLTASSVFVSLARGGIIAFSVSLMFFFFLLARKRARYTNLFYVGLLACLIITVAWFGWSPILERFGQTLTNTGELNFDRIPIWRDSLQVIKHFWLTGSGFGTFLNIFPQFKTIPGDIVFDHAHNDYIELLTDGGIIGFGLAAWFVGVVIREGWKMIGRRRDRYSILVSIGALSGIVGMLIHSISDFNMHNGADGLYFFFLCGLLVSAANTRLHYQGKATLLKNVSHPVKKPLLAAGCIFFAVVIIIQGGALLAEFEHGSVKDIYISRQLAPEYLTKIYTANKQAARFDPFNGMYPFWLAQVERYREHPDKALEYYMQAAEKDPLEGAFLQRIALMLPKKDQQYAEVLMEKGAERTLHKDDLMLTQAQWLLGNGSREKGIGILREALKRNPHLVTVVIPMLQSFSFSRAEVVSVLPQSVGEWIQYAAYLEKSGDFDGAEYFYGHALDFLQNETVIKPDWFRLPYNFYTKQHEPEKALEILRLGVKKVPDYALFHIWLGDHYARQGITYRALEEYQQALLIEPRNESVASKIEKLKGE